MVDDPTLIVRFLEWLATAHWLVPTLLAVALMIYLAFELWPSRVAKAEMRRLEEEEKRWLAEMEKKYPHSSWPRNWS